MARCHRCSPKSEKRFINTVAILAVIIVQAFALIALFTLYTIQLHAVHTTTQIILIAFAALNIAMFVATIYCAVKYQKAHRYFLLIIVVIYTVTCGFLAFFFPIYDHTFIKMLTYIWTDEITNSINKLESKFNCHGFNPDEPDTTCYNNIKNFLKTRSEGAIFFMGLFFVFFFISAVYIFFAVCKYQTQDDAEPSMEVNNLDEIQQPLNQEGNLDI